MARRLSEFLTFLSLEERSRDETEIGSYVTWLRRRVALLKYIPTKDIIEIIRYARHKHVDSDELLFQQAHNRDSTEPTQFFIILRGSMSMFLNPFLKHSSTGRTTAISIQRSFLSGGSRAEVLSAKLSEPPKSAASKRTTGSKKSSSTRFPVIEDPESDVSDADSDVTIPTNDGVDVEAAPDVLVSNERKTPQSQISKASKSRSVRSKLGKFVVKYEKGKYFDEGEILSEGSEYTASIIADENTEILVLDNQSFNKFVKQQHEQEVTKLTNFVDIHPFFCDLPLYSKGVIQISLKPETFNAGDFVVKQGDPLNRLMFIINGSAEVVIEPNKHRYQYPHLWPFETSTDVYYKECEWLRESRRRIYSLKYELRGEVSLRAQRSKDQRPVVSVCAIQNKEVIGITEFALGLQTHLQSVRCLHDCEILWLNIRPFRRIVKRRNPEIMDLINSYVYMKMKYRIANTIGEKVPLFQSLLSLIEKMIPKPTSKESQTKGNQSIKEYEKAVLEMISWFRLDKSPLMLNRDPYILRLKEEMKDKANLREKLRQRYVEKPFFRIGCQAAIKHDREPRSFNQLKSQMNENLGRLRFGDSFSEDEGTELTKSSDSEDIDGPGLSAEADTILIDFFRSRRHGNKLIRKFQDILERAEQSKSRATVTTRHHEPSFTGTVKFGGLTPVRENDTIDSDGRYTKMNRASTMESRSTTMYPLQFEHRSKTPNTLCMEIRDFHQKYGGTQSEIKTLPMLKKVEENMFDIGDRPLRGGTVLVTTTPCVSCSKNIMLKNHSHVRCQMLRPIPSDRL